MVFINILGELMELPKNKLFENLIGRKFGKYIVLDYVGARWPHNRSKGHQWLCLCECGNKKIVLGGPLKSGNTLSCGCYHKKKLGERLIDLTGKRFGQLVVVELIGRKHKQPLWKCMCDCGKETTVAGNSLKAGRSKSCGAGNCCGRGLGRGNWKHGLSTKPGYKKWLLNDPTRKMRHYIGSIVQTTLKKNKGSKYGESTFKYLPYTPEQLKNHLESLWEPWMSWDNYGGKPDDVRRTWWIDHIKPHSFFKYQSLDDPLFVECWALFNLRPLEKKENILKSTK